MGSHKTPSEDRHAQALHIGGLGGCTRLEHKGPVSSVAANRQRFTGYPPSLASGARRWDTSGTLAQLTLQPTPWIAVAFPRLLVRRG